MCPGQFVVFRGQLVLCPKCEGRNVCRCPADEAPRSGSAICSHFEG